MTVQTDTILRQATKELFTHYVDAYGLLFPYRRWAVVSVAPPHQAPSISTKRSHISPDTQNSRTSL